MSVVDNNRPPYVVFEERDFEDRSESLVKGFYCSKSKDIAVITRPGSNDSLEKEALVWLNELREKSRKGELPPNWYEHFKGQYDSWKNGVEAKVNGTPIKGCTFLSLQAQKLLIHVGILSVEDLASLPDSELASVGTGALSYKQKAQAFLDTANGPGKVAEELAAQRLQLSELIALTKEQAKEINDLRARVPKETSKA